MDAKRVVDYYIKGSNDISEFDSIIDDCVDVVIGLKTLRLSLIGDKRIWSLIDKA